MKTFVLSAFILFQLITCAFGQKIAALDKSPMDRAYFPDNFAHDRKAGDKAIIRVIYSRPAKGDRQVFGKLVPYGKVWRTGANEATEIKFYQDVELAGKKVKEGTYSLFTIPGEKEWTIILSSDVDYWGAYSYNEKNDVVRFTAPVTETTTPVDNFTIQFDKSSMKFLWDKTVVEVPISVGK